MIWITLCLWYVSAQDIDIATDQENLQVWVKINRKQFPERANAEDRQNRTRLDDWLDILPTKDFGADTFVVYPRLGLVTPLHTINSSDAELVAKWKKFDHYPYLEQGVLQYAWTEIGSDTWTAIIAWHSSFRDVIDNPYYTVFQAVPMSVIWDQIWIYKRVGQEVERYIYEIQESYEVSPKERSRVEEQKSYASITTYSCYPLWSNASRRVNHAKLLSVETEEEIDFHQSAPDPEIATNENADIKKKISIENWLKQEEIYADKTIEHKEIVVQKTNKEVESKLDEKLVLQEEEVQEEQKITAKIDTKTLVVSKITENNRTWWSAPVTPSVDVTPQFWWEHNSSVMEEKGNVHSITYEELAYIYSKTRTSMYYKVIFVKIILRLQQKTMTLEWNSK